MQFRLVDAFQVMMPVAECTVFSAREETHIQVFVGLVRQRKRKSVHARREQMPLMREDFIAGRCNTIYPRCTRYAET